MKIRILVACNACHLIKAECLIVTGLKLRQLVWSAVGRRNDEMIKLKVHAMLDILPHGWGLLLAS